MPSLRREIIEALCRKASAEEATRARSCLKTNGNIIADLIDAGLHRRMVIAACTEATGIPKASSAWFKETIHVPLDDIDIEVCTQNLCVPIAVEDGELCIAFGDPTIAVARDELELPPHRAFLATPTKVARALKRLVARVANETTGSRPRAAVSSESSALSNKVRKKRRNEKRAVSTEGEPLDLVVPEPQWDMPKTAPQPEPAPPREEVRARPAPSPAPSPSAPPRPAASAAPARPSTRVAPPATALRAESPLDPVLPPAHARGAIDPALAPSRGPRPAPQRAQRAPARPRDGGKPQLAPEPGSLRGPLLGLLLVGVSAVAWTMYDRTRPRTERGGGDAPVDVPGDADLSSRQRALMKKAAQEVSSVAAVNLLTTAINLDPGSEAGRDAFLARARLYLAGGELERARRDLLRLQKRPDAAPLHDEVEALLADIAKRLGPSTDVAPRPPDGPAPTTPGAPSPAPIGAPAAAPTDTGR